MKRKEALSHFIILTSIIMSAVAWAASAGAQYLFDDPVNYPAGIIPVDVAVADFNVDGSADLAVVDESSTGIHIFLNRGDGILREEGTSSAGLAPQAIETAYLDGDIYPDLVVSNRVSQNISVLTGRGDGTFDDAVQYTAQQDPKGISVADLNGDGHQDVSVVNRESQSVSVFLNNGDGTFYLSSHLHSGGSYTHPSWVNAADLDQDNDMDLIVTKNYFNLYFTAGYVEVFFNDGNGDFTSIQTLEVANVVNTPLVFDADGDEDPDVVVPVSGSSYYAAVLRNPGNGILQEPEFYHSGGSGRASAGDLDGDNDIDLIIAREGIYTSSFSVVFNDGDGAFGDAYTEVVGDQPRGSILGDLDGDGDLEVAVAVWEEGYLSVLSNTTNQAPLSLAVFSEASHYRKGDPLIVHIAGRNNTDETLEMQVWTEGRLPGGKLISPILGPKERTVPPHTEISSRITHQLPPNIPIGGPYLYRVNVGSYPDNVLVQDAMTFFIDP
jgi:hypothetical protein